MYRIWLERKVGQVVMVVIDALRADFVFPENLLKQSGQFSRADDNGAWQKGGSGHAHRKRPKIRSLHDLIQAESKLVNPFLARANTPTVTLPRIKVSSI